MTHPKTLRGRRLAALALAAALGLGATACGSDAEPAGTGSPTTSPTESSAESPAGSPAGQVIDVTFSGDEVTPNGDRVDVGAGDELTLHITADAPGEIHVHSSPEQELTYEAGVSDLSVTIDQPGLVDVESHDLDLVIVQLEVR